jgi:hypothetical protein
VRRTIFASSRRGKRKAMRSAVTLDGVDVTRYCQAADDRAGCVLLIVRDDAGRVVLDGSDVLRVWVHGRVRIRRGDRVTRTRLDVAGLPPAARRAFDAATGRQARRRAVLAGG